MKLTYWLVAVAIATLAGCGGQDRHQQARARGEQPGMASMPMGGSMPGMNTMTTMHAYLDSVSRMSPEQMAQMMTRHEPRMAQMMDAMGADMRRMNMAGDSAWKALIDSVRRDLADLPGLRSQERSTRVKAHVDRVQRLLVMHERMMKGMQK